MSGFLQGAPPREQGPLVNAPAPVLLLILSFVIVHAIQMLGGEGNRLWMIFNFGLHPLHVTDTGGWATALLWFPVWIKFVSHAFLHVDLVHLAFNSLWFLVFGSTCAPDGHVALPGIVSGDCHGGRTGACSCLS